MKQKILTLFVALLTGLAAWAHDFVVDGIYYKITSSTNLTVSVSCRGDYGDSYSNEYSGAVVIPESVTYNGKSYSVTGIGSSAFRSCSMLTSVVIPSSVTEIGEYAFYGCSGLTSVVIPSSVTKIGNYAFNGCTSLKNLTIEDGSETLSLGYNYYMSNDTGKGLFYDCPLESVYLGRNISYNSDYHYGYSPFYNKSGMTELTIGEQVTEIGSYAFNGCGGLTSVVIPSSVTSIGSSAFNGCSGLTSVVIPSSVTSIGSFAFYGCSGLTSVVIPSSVTSIGSSAFRSCSMLTSVVIPSSVTEIGEYAFDGCSGLTSVVIPSSVTKIGNYAFNGCTSLKNLTIEDGSETLSLGYNNYEYNNSSGKGLFYDCPLESVYLGRNISFDSGSKYGYSPFYYKRGMTELTIGAQVTSIGSYAFSSCSGLTSVVIPSRVTEIGSYAFYDCRGLTSVVIPSSVTEIGSYAFSGCSGLTSVTIPSSVTSIGERAFYDCRGLTSVVIPSSVTEIGKLAFNNVTKAFFLTNTKPSIGSSAFSSCMVYYTANNDSYGISGTHKVYSLLSSMFEVDGVKYIPTSMSARTCDMVDVDYSAETVNSAIGPTVKYTNSTGRQYDFKVNKVNMYAAYGCKALSDLVLKNEGVIEIYAFYNSSATAIDVNNSVTTVGDYAFSGCTAATAITASNNGNIGDCAFSGCTSATSITASNNGTIGGSAFSGCMTTGDGTINISNKGNIYGYAFQNCTKATSIDINNEGSLGQSAFSGCSGATEIKIADKITSIGVSCFSGCSSLLNITIPKLITAINSSTFYRCSSMTAVTFNKAVTSIGSDAFENCSKLASLTIPANVTSISSGAFDGCTSIGDLTFEDSENDISLDCRFVSGKNLYLGRNITYSMSKASPFSGNNVLETVTTNMNVTSVPNYEFYNCKSLKDVYLSDAVTSVGTYAFSGDIALRNFEVGVSVESIGAEAFSDCTALLEFTSHSIVPATVGTEALDDIDKLECTLHVPEGTEDAYAAADQWKEFWIDGDLLPRYKVMVSVDSECVGMGIVKGSDGYDKNTTATLEAVPAENYVFVEWSDGNKQNPRTMTVTGATNLTAKFAYRYYIKTQPTANNISVALSEMVSGVVYKWYVSESAGGAKNITNDLQSTGNYAWTKSNGVWTSGNKGVNSSSSTLSMNITAKAGDKLTFDYSVSSESGFDYLKIYLGSNQIGNSYSGSASGTYEYTFTSGMNTTLKFVYSKDGSGDNGSDQATISNVVIGNGAAATILDGETTGAVSVSSLEKDKYYYCEITMPDGVVLTSDQVQYVGGDVKTYTISVTSANGTVTGAGTYVSGATVVLDATPATGYRFVRWSDGNTTNPRTITVTGNVTLSAVYEAIKYAVSVTANNGSVSGAGEYPHGSSVTISATPATGYRFVRWSDGNTSNPRTITVTSEVSLSAVFEQIKYKITLTATNGAVNGAGTYAYGTSATIQATPATGYKFVSWSDGNTTNPRVINVSDNLNLEAVFTKESTPEVVVGGSEHGSAGVTEINGNSQTITVTPDKGYIVGTVTVDGEDVTDNMIGNTYIINNVTVNVNVTVVFISIAETAKVSASAGGNVEAVEYDGDKIVLSVTPDAGYEFDAIYVNGAKIAIYNKAASSIMGEKNLDGTYSISGLEENAEIVVNFKVASIMTPVGSITADKPSREGIYDLMGRKLSAPQRGVNIINGKKVLVK